jgi:DNA-binding CsgD family transcriptional regulator
MDEPAKLPPHISDLWPRSALVARILSSPVSLVVLDAGAGMGKSTLLAQLAAKTGSSVQIGPKAPLADQSLILWDIPAGCRPDPMPQTWLQGAGVGHGVGLIIAKRPATTLPGLPRAVLYGLARVLGTSDLLFTEEELARFLSADQARERFALSGGWPLLINAPKVDATVMNRFLQEEVVAPLALPDFARVVAAFHPTRYPTLDISELIPLPAQNGPLREGLAVALNAGLDSILQDDRQALAIGHCFAAQDHLPYAIEAYHRAGRPDLALETLIRGHSDFFIHQYGAEAFDRALSGFSPEFAGQHEVLMICAAMQALKRGDLALARRLIADWHGPIGNDPDAVLAPQSGFSAEFRAFRLVMLVYEDLPLTDDLLSRAFSLLEEIPVDAHRARGSFYNAILEFFIRWHRFAEAEDVARRAGYHYRLAEVPLLSFYVSVHQSIIRLMTGDPAAARLHAQAAQSDLARVPFDSPADGRLLTLLVACIDYEGGKVEPLARFLNLDMDDFSRGETWPSLIELTLQYGSLALSDHYSTLAARGFLDRWRAYQLRNPRFGLMIDQRDVAVLQNGNRWQEAAERLASLPHRISRSWVLNNTSELSRLTDRDDLAAALLWLRHLAFEAPNRPGLPEKLMALSTNLHLTARQRVGLAVWLAYAHRRARNLTAARAILLKTFETVARTGAIAPLIEERAFLADLLANERIASFLEASASVRHVLRRVRDAGPALGGPAFGLAGRNAGLTRQEARVLQALCEGASNKFIAHTLGVSEATVKFHLGNCYRKLGCQNRKQAIQSAINLGMIS